MRWLMEILNIEIEERLIKYCVIKYLMFLKIRNTPDTKRVLLQWFIYFFLSKNYTLVQTKVINNKTETEIIQSQTKNKTSLPYYVHVMRHEI